MLDVRSHRGHRNVDLCLQFRAAERGPTTLAALARRVGARVQLLLVVATSQQRCFLPLQRVNLADYAPSCGPADYLREHYGSLDRQSGTTIDRHQIDRHPWGREPGGQGRHTLNRSYQPSECRLDASTVQAYSTLYDCKLHWVGTYPPTRVRSATKEGQN